MADATQTNDAFRQLGEMTKLLSTTINHKGGKFTDADVVTLMVGWLQVSANMRGSGIIRVLKASMLLKRKVEGGDPRFTRPGELLADLNVYKGKVADASNSDNEYIQAQKSILNFLYEY